MVYNKPELTAVSLNVKGAARENQQDGPSKCSNSCCYYKDGATW